MLNEISGLLYGKFVYSIILIHLCLSVCLSILAMKPGLAIWHNGQFPSQLMGS